MKKINIKRFAILALMCALCYIGCMFLSVKVATSLYIHLGNVFCLLTVLMLSGVEGGIAGAVGMGIADLTDGLHAVSFPKTVVCKMAMALVVGVFTHKVFKVNETQSKKGLFLSLLFGIIANVIFEIGFGYIYYHFILGTVGDAFTVFFASKIISVSFTSVITLIITFIIYFPLYNRIKNYL